MKIGRRVITCFVPILVSCVSRFIYFTCVNRFHISEGAKNTNFIACLWHGNFLMMPFLYNRIRAGSTQLSLVTSLHEDGDLVDRYFGLFGFRSIRGGTSRGGARVILQAISELKQNRDVAITPDGPRGPYKSIKDGIIIIAIKSGRPICPCVVRANKCWTLNTWDKFFIPKPFSVVEYYIGDCIYFSEGVSIEQAKVVLSESMDAVC